jgi:hypothetical protein
MFGKHPHYQPARELHREAFEDEVREFVQSGTRKTPQFDTSDGATHTEREVIGGYQTWRKD